MKKLESLKDCIAIVSSLYEMHEKKHSFTSFCEKSFPLGIWFRGEENYGDSMLIPSVFREINKKLYNETRLFSYARTRFPVEYHSAKRELSKSEYAVFPSLVYMQHYGIPSRLLDWTESITSAIFFAVEKDESGRDGLIHVLNARKLNSITSFASSPQNIHEETDFGTVFRCIFCDSDTKVEWLRKAHDFSEKVGFNWKHGKLPEVIRDQPHAHSGTNIPITAIDFLAQPIAVIPGLVHERLKSQQGVFTLHGGKIMNKKETKKGNQLPQEKTLVEINNELRSKDKFLKTYLIPKDCKSRIKTELLALGIRAGTIYPEADKQGEHLKEMFRI